MMTRKGRIGKPPEPFKAIDIRAILRKPLKETKYKKWLKTNIPCSKNTSESCIFESQINYKFNNPNIDNDTDTYKLLKSFIWSELNLNKRFTSKSKCKITFKFKV